MNNQYYPVSDLKLTNFIHKAGFNLERFFVDLHLGTISAHMFVPRCELVTYDNGKKITPNLDDLILDDTAYKINSWIEVYPEKIYQLFYTGKEIKNDFLKTPHPYEETYGEGSYYETEFALEKLEQLYLSKGISDTYLNIPLSTLKVSDDFFEINGAVLPRF